jgi:hypothetical protein
MQKIINLNARLGNFPSLTLNPFLLIILIRSHIQNLLQPVTSSLDRACGIRGFEAPINPYSAKLHTGYELRETSLRLIYGASS